MLFRRFKATVNKVLGYLSYITYKLQDRQSIVYFGMSADNKLIYFVNSFVPIDLWKDKMV